MASIALRIVQRLAGAPISLQFGIHEIKQIPTAAMVLAIGLIHVIAFARLAQRLLRIRFRGNVGASAYLAMGYAFFGFYLWILGYARLLYPRPLEISACVFGLIVVADRGWWAGLGHYVAAMARTARQWPLLAITISLLILLCFLTGLRDVRWVEDWDYHWQSPVVWAQAGRWVASPYRLSNGPALSEMINVLGAMFNSPAGANWMATLAFLIASLCVAGLVQPLGVPAPIAVMTAFSMPIFFGDANMMNSDIPATCFALAAFVFLLRGLLSGDLSTPADRARAVLASGIMLAAVYAAKFIVLGCLPAAVLITFFCFNATFIARIKGVSLLLAPLLVMVVLGMLHTYHMIGKPIDNSGKFMAKDENDWRYKTGVAAGRIPTVHSILRLPIEPWITTIWGKREPYGGRTGILWPTMLPMAIYFAFRRGFSGTYLFALLFTACTMYFFIGAVSLKTRFVMMVFLILATAGAAAYAHRDRLNPLSRKLLTIAFILFCAIDMSFGLRKILFGVLLEMPNHTRFVATQPENASE